MPPKGVKILVLQPIGFLCDHVEILYDVDIAFRGYAAELGIRVQPPELLNWFAHPGMWLPMWSGLSRVEPNFGPLPS